MEAVSEKAQRGTPPALTGAVEEGPVWIKPAARGEWPVG